MIPKRVDFVLLLRSHLRCFRLDPENRQSHNISFMGVSHSTKPIQDQSPTPFLLFGRFLAETQRGHTVLVGEVPNLPNVAADI
jgi:hypothetical protein